jgi:hypothetical protein
MRVHAGSTRAYNRWTYTRNCNILKTLLHDSSGTYWKLILKLYSLKYIGVCLKDTTYELDKSTKFASHCSISASPLPRRLLMVPLHGGNPDWSLPMHPHVLQHLHCSGGRRNEFDCDCRTTPQWLQVGHRRREEHVLVRSIPSYRKSTHHITSSI